ncbi:Ferrochelatase [Dissostichus eleginoides]|uniref:Ferrochelatase n=1 Tax=Dissostichus eleginoides TaxID=100907 RepID=A0AAD9CS77_DISEL|nr:Ferrochelatase [Dissostichus eleginoides]
MYVSGIDPPDIRRAIITKAERTEHANDNQPPLHEHPAAQKRLKSRSSFLDTTEVLETKGRCNASMKKWKTTTSDACVCGESQTIEHIMRCSRAPQCNGNDLGEPNAAALACANH